MMVQPKEEKGDNRTKSIRITPDTHRRLTKHMRYGITYEDLINFLIDAYEGKVRR